MNRLPRMLLGLLGLGLLNACASLEPWVAPYEREYLADPLMNYSLQGSTQAFLQHVHEVREGARGGLNQAGGGCGCN